jgi:hypothetical protein
MGSQILVEMSLVIDHRVLKILHLHSLIVNHNSSLAFFICPLFQGGRVPVKTNKIFYPVMKTGTEGVLPIFLFESEPDKVIELEAKNKHNQNFDKQKHQF